MTSFPQRRLQVFVSSTYTDLITERQAAVEAILTAGHIPAGMELFTAGDESQMDVIKNWIDASDVFLLILGGRYGSIEPISQKSYTHLEYEYALNQGKRLFSCVIHESALDNRAREHGLAAIEQRHPDALQQFRSQALSRISSIWHDFKDIKIAISSTLAKFARDNSLSGWVRADQSADIPAMADELTRLSRENSELRAKVSKLEHLEGPREIRENWILVQALRAKRYDVISDGTEYQFSLEDVVRHAGPLYAGLHPERFLLQETAHRLQLKPDITGPVHLAVVNDLLSLGLVEYGANREYMKFNEKGREVLRGLTLEFSQSEATSESAS